MRQLWTRLTASARLVTGVVRANTEEREMNEEMRFHIDRETEKLMANGMSAADARRAALVAFGGTSRWAESARDEFRSRPLDEIRRDVSYAMRSLRRSPTFTAAVLLTLAVGIGATSTVYTVTERVVLRPLSYGAGGDLLMLWTGRTDRPGDRGVNSFADYADWTTNNPDLQYASIFNIWTPTLTDAGEPEPLVGSRVSADFFKVLGVRPMLGRAFRPEEDVVGGPNVVVISASLWQRRFAGDAAIVGRVIHLNDLPYTVIGVLPPGFRNPEPNLKGTADVWRPLSLNDGAKVRMAHFLRVIVRLRPGVTLSQADRDFSLISARLAKAYPEADAQHTIVAVPMQDQIVGQSKTVLFAVLGAALCLLLIVCGNVASLILARHAAREPELALRTAIGAARGRLMMMLFSESIVLALAGGALGLGICLVATSALRHAAPADLPRVDEIRVDGAAFAVTAAISLGAAVLFGLVPAIRSARRNGLERGTGRSTAQGRGRGAIVVAELALCVMLLASAGLLTRSLLRLNGTPVGVDTRDLLTFRINLPAKSYPSDSADALFFSNLIQRIRFTRGIHGVAAASFLPLTPVNDLTLLVGGSARSPSKRGIDTHVRAVTPGYFELLHVKVTGREFTDADTRSSPRVVIINRTAAAEFFPGENAVGQQFLVSPVDSVPATVVGVVEDVRFAGPASEPQRELFQPFAQSPWSAAAVVVRTEGSPMASLNALRGVVRELDPKLPLIGAAPMAEHLRSYSARQRFYALVFGLFGLTAMVLSAIGVYGLIAYGVVQRRREMAIRMALGAQTSDVLATFLRTAVALIAAGAALGMAGSMFVGKTLSTLLFEVQPTDMAALTTAVVILSVVAIVASLVPALSARKVPLASTLRS
jgi:putative ABC transport system permease protein